MFGKFRLEEIFLRFRFLGSLFQETLIFRTQHDDVQIVVPRDESLVPHRSECGACKELVADPKAAADIVKHRQQLQQRSLMLFQLFISPYRHGMSSQIH